MKTVDARRIAPTAQPATQPLHPLWQALLDHLEQSQGIEQATAPPIDFRAFLAAMQDTAHHSAQAAKEATARVQAKAPPNFHPLATETRVTLPTPEAAFHMNRAQQTLRLWATGNCPAPIRPLRVNGRLAWPVSELRRVLGVA